MLTLLTEVLSIDVLSNWCDLETVAKVDSAFCNKTDRPLNFLGLLADPFFGSSERTDGRLKSFWEWVGQRAIKVRSMTVVWNDNLLDRLVTNVDCSKVTEFFVLHLNQVDLVAQLINRSTCLKTLQINGLQVWPGLNRLISLITDQTLSSLNNLSVSRSHQTNFVQLQNIATICSQLVVLSLTNVRTDALIQIIRNNVHLRDLILKLCVCNTFLMKVINNSCAEMRSLTISDINIDSLDTNCCSIESVSSMVANKRHLNFCSLGDGVYFTAVESTSILISKQPFVPIFPTFLTKHCIHLRKITLLYMIDETMSIEISYTCPQLTSLCIFEGDWSAHCLRSIVTRCTKLQILSLRFVNATFDEMVSSIFCSNQILVLSTIIVLTTISHPQLVTKIKNSNSSVVYCRTAV
jgi:hypothetical protein